MLTQPELWQKLSSRLRSQVANGLDIESVAGFCGVDLDTVREWVIEKHAPRGSRLIKLWHYLAANGSLSPEIKAMPELNAYVSELFGFGIIELSEVQAIFKLVVPQKAYDAMRGRPAMYPQFTLIDLQQLYREQLNQAKRNALSRSAVGRLPAKKPNLSLSLPQQVITHVTAESDQQAMLLLAALLGAALPYAQWLNSDECSDEQRDTLRKLTGETIFNLSNLLNSLCSKRARDGRKHP